jgi:hypothetical protein
MIASFVALAATCANSPATLLKANSLAMGSRPSAGTAIARYSYEGQGLKGWTSTTIDLGSGRFIDEAQTPPIEDLHGFDGHTAWFRDLSGSFVPQGINGRRAVAVSEAYLNAQAWLRNDRGGARIELAGCNILKVTPPGGNTFEASFDSQTKLLSSVRQTVTYGTRTETRFSNYQRRGTMMVPSRIDMFTNEDPSTVETMRLSAFRLAAALREAKYQMRSSRPTDWSLPPSGRVTIPFRLLNNHVIVDVKVNGKGPFPFLLDTGGHAIVTPATLKALGLSSTGLSTSGGSGEKMVTNGYARIDRFDVGGAALTRQTVATLDFSPLAVEGIQLGGMLGLEFMERFVVRIDYGRRTITIMNPKTFGRAEKKASGTAIPFTFYEHMPQIKGTFDGKAAVLDIDTGSRSDVTMTSPFVERWSLREAYPNAILATEGWGVGGPARAYLVRAHSMKLGPVDVPGPIAGLSTAKNGAMSDRTYDGNVGSGLLKRFVVTFDYGDRMLFLKPATQIDGDTSQFDRSGMWLNQASGGLEVMDLVKGGPADEAGLRIGDIVTKIDGTALDMRSLSEVRSSLKTAQVGRPLTIDYLRAGRSSVTKLVPRKLISD